MDTNEYMTEAKRKELIEELQTLESTKRKEILDALEFAKSLGDLSENAEYHQAREEQGKLEERIQKIQYLLKSSVIVKKHHSTKVEIGSTVHVQKEGTKDKVVYQIVGSEEADMAAGKISHKSPLGIALFGKAKGDKTSFQSPKGSITYTIVDIE